MATKLVLFFVFFNIGKLNTIELGVSLQILISIICYILKTL